LRTGGSRRSRERGVALIMALLIVALVTAIVVEVSWRFSLSMARNENRWHGAQARAYLEGGEQLARKVLLDDAIDPETSQTDAPWEPWAQESPAMPTEEGWVRGKLEDGNSRFNLNTLVPPQGQPPGGQPGGQPGIQPPGTQPPIQPLTAADFYNEPQRRLARFLQTITLEKEGPMPQQMAFEIVLAITDWIDQDSTIAQGGMGDAGAEAGDYESLDPPVIIANTYMTSISELSLVKGVTPEIFRILEPFVIALPPEGFTMNINTIRPELVRAFNVKDNLMPLDQALADALIQARNEPEPEPNPNKISKGFTSVAELQSLAETAGIRVNPTDVLDLSGLDVRSIYFIYRGETLVGEQLRRSKSLLFRPNPGLVEIVRRTDGNF
jgi:general secretion pathway protein K